MFKLLIKQANASVVYNQYKHVNKQHNKTDDPPHKWPLEIDKKNRKLTLTFPLIEEWFTDTNYYDDIDYVMSLFNKVGLIKHKKDFFRLIRDYLYRSEYEKLTVLNPGEKKKNLKLAGDMAKKRIKNAKEKNELTLSSIYSNPFEESSLIVD